jgi:Asp-tRNA(Asn)/Glu-tRNA(Gln) amidotransferase A subunit family amidase
MASLSKAPSAVAATEAALARIGERDADLRAWVYIDADSARSQAVVADAESRPLAGVTLGVKDIIDVDGMPCRLGSPIFAERIAANDAALVARLKRLGAVVVGKTATAEFAYLHPPETRNPRDKSRSPGGSSSGSAAAVADGHVDAALGTQTAGSLLRPASFCGVVGFKPTFGRLSRAGILSTAPSLDTVGWIARDASVATRIWKALENEADAQSLQRFGFCRTMHWPNAEPAMRSAFERVAAALSAREIPPPPESVENAHLEIMRYEMGQELAAVWLQQRSRLSTELTDWLRLPPVRFDAYRAAQRARDAFDVDALFAGVDVVLAPAACGEAVSYGSTGDGCFNRLGTLLGLPCVSIPMAIGEQGLPLGLQLIGRRDQDGALLATAARLEAEFALRA